MHSQWKRGFESYLVPFVKLSSAGRMHVRSGGGARGAGWLTACARRREHIALDLKVREAREALDAFAEDHAAMMEHRQATRSAQEDAERNLATTRAQKESVRSDWARKLQDRRKEVKMRCACFATAMCFLLRIHKKDCSNLHLQHSIPSRTIRFIHSANLRALTPWQRVKRDLW